MVLCEELPKSQLFGLDVPICINTWLWLFIVFMIILFISIFTYLIDKKRSQKSAVPIAENSGGSL